MRDLTPVGGIHSVRTALKFGLEGVGEIWLERSRRDHRTRQIVDLARAAGIAVRQVDRADMDGAAAGLRHQGVLAWVRTPAPRAEHELDAILEAAAGPPFLLILDGVQDPHNLGACLRTADAAGVHAVLAPKDNAVGLTPVACKVASGAAETVPYVQVTNLVRAMDALEERGVWLVGTAGAAETALFDADLEGALGLVMGGEGKGLRRLTAERCDLLVCLPMSGAVESLNVSVAAGICLYEAVRQRRWR
jgi:23S rRNA (guanosine2251-2'-O)-methyltransferase